MNELKEDYSIEELEAILASKKQSELNRKIAERDAYESMRDGLIHKLCGKAIVLRDNIMSLKTEAFDDLNSIKELVQQYAKTVREEWKGNFSIESADGQYKIEFIRQVTGKFDERSNEAEILILDFVKSRFKDDVDAQMLITQLLEKKKGELDINLVQKLYSMEDKFQDESWVNGIRLLKESWVEKSTKEYIRFSVKGSSNNWQAIKLDFAAL